MKVIVDKDICQGYALCVMDTPEVFDLDEDTGKSIVLQASPSEELRAKVETAVRNCPAKAITLQET